MQPGKCVLVLDFAKNYSFVVQGAAQGFHLNNSQATIRPFVLYYVDPATRKLCHKSKACISNHMVHDTVTVYYLLQKLLTEYVKAEFTHFHKVFYFSDGSGAQYKNFKNFTSLLLQEQNFDLKAEWHFFATSQGKKIHGVISFFIRTEHGDQVTQFLQPRFSNSPKFNGTHKNYQFIPVGNNIQMSCVSRDSGRAGLINNQE